MRVNRVFLRRNMIRVFFVFWQALRGVAAILLLGLLGLLAVALVTYLSEVQKKTEAAPNVSSGNRPGWVCGKILGTVIEVPSSYVLFWAEYEGKSSWEKGFTENKKGCDANFSSVSMALSWPYLLPVRTSEYTTAPYGKFQGVVLTLEQNAARYGYLDYLINNMLEASASEVESADSYQEKLGLFLQEKDNKYLPGEVNGYYWKRSAEKVPVVFSCRRRKTEKEFYKCTGYFVIEKIGALAQVELAPSKLKDWPAVVDAMNAFVLSNIKQ